jgi:hypothetical protein
MLTEGVRHARFRDDGRAGAAAVVRERREYYRAGCLSCRRAGRLYSDFFFRPIA